MMNVVEAGLIMLGLGLALALCGFLLTLVSH